MAKSNSTEDQKRKEDARERLSDLTQSLQNFLLIIATGSIFGTFSLHTATAHPFEAWLPVSLFLLSLVLVGISIGLAMWNQWVELGDNEDKRSAGKAKAAQILTVLAYLSAGAGLIVLALQII